MKIQIEYFYHWFCLQNKITYTTELILRITLYTYYRNFWTIVFQLLKSFKMLDKYSNLYVKI